MYIVASKAAMNKLTIDIGNTLIKVALFKDAEMEWCMPFNQLEANQLQLLMHTHQVKHVIASNVSAASTLTFEQIEGFVKLTPHLKLPFVNYYESPETLGSDRMALAAATQYYFKGKPCVVFDAGTCLTLDLVTADQIYLGGIISPGLQMRLNGMHYFTGKLPQLTAAFVENKIGANTIDCMQSGAYFGMIAEIEYHIQALKAKYPDLQVLLCGGNAELLSKQLKSPLFVEKNLLMYGLHLILDLNV